MQMAPYLTLDGVPRDAFDVYARSLGGDIVSMMTFGETPGCGDMPAESHDRIMHAAMGIDGLMLMASDSVPGQFEGNKGGAIPLHVNRPADAETLFKTMSDGGQATMAMTPTSWDERFGVSWIVDCAGDCGSRVEP